MTNLRYKGYQGEITNMDYKKGIIYGEVLLTKDVVTFQANTPKELFEELKKSIDDYLKWCAAEGTEPDRPLKGEILVRCPPELQAKIQMEVTEKRNQGEKISQNDWCVEALREKLLLKKVP